MAQAKIDYDKAQYDKIADQYVHALQSIYHQKIVAPNFLHLLGEGKEVKDKQVITVSFKILFGPVAFHSYISFSFLKILDLACGDGLYTRTLKAMGARKSVGVDISASMLLFLLYFTKYCVLRFD